MQLLFHIKVGLFEPVLAVTLPHCFHRVF